jgi:hypothetical protein
VEDFSTTKFLAFYTLFFLLPLSVLVRRLFNIEKEGRRTADALEKIAKSLEAKPLKLDDVIDLDQTL